MLALPAYVLLIHCEHVVTRFTPAMLQRTASCRSEELGYGLHGLGSLVWNDVSVVELLGSELVNHRLNPHPVDMVNHGVHRGVEGDTQDSHVVLAYDLMDSDEDMPMLAVVTDWVTDGCEVAGHHSYPSITCGAMRSISVKGMVWHPTINSVSVSLLTVNKPMR